MWFKVAPLTAHNDQSSRQDRRRDRRTVRRTHKDTHVWLEMKENEFENLHVENISRIHFPLGWGLVRRDSNRRHSTPLHSTPHSSDIIRVSQNRYCYEK